MTVFGQIIDRVTGGRATKRDFETRFDRWLEDGQSRDGDGEALVDAFLRSGGVWLSEASRKVAARNPSYDFAQAHDGLGLWREPGSFERTLADLLRDGYAICDVLIPDAVVEDLSTYFASAPCTLTSDMGSELRTGETVSVDFVNPVAEKYAVTTDATVQNATVRELMLDRGLLQIAQAYCGSVPSIDIVIAWYSFPQPYASHQAGQLFHFDLDRIRWLKAFLLLTDQDAETGAHAYIPGTQADRGIDKALLARGYARLEDDEVADYHPRSEWKVMEGRKGVVLLEDTRGLHKGIPLVRDHRLMLQFEYAQAMFGHPSGLAQTPLSPIDDTYWAQMNSAYPELFTEFRH